VEQETKIGLSLRCFLVGL